MRIVQIQDLQAQDIQSIDEHQLLFHGQLFRLGPKISKKLEKAALEYCQICCKAGQICLLQEDDSHWIVWKRVRKGRSSGVTQPSSQPNTLSSQFLNRCQQELVNCIGPIAELVLEQTLSEQGTANLEPQEFIAALSQRIPSPSLASAFYDHCQQAREAEVMASRIRSIKLDSPVSRYTFNQNRRVHSPVSI